MYKPRYCKDFQDLIDEGRPRLNLVKLYILADVFSVVSCFSLYIRLKIKSHNHVTHAWKSTVRQLPFG